MALIDLLKIKSLFMVLLNIEVIRQSKIVDDKVLHYDQKQKLAGHNVKKTDNRHATQSLHSIIQQITSVCINLNLCTSMESSMTIINYNQYFYKINFLVCFLLLSFYYTYMLVHKIYFLMPRTRNWFILVIESLINIFFLILIIYNTWTQ